jgi:hypothetical protein
VSVACLWVALSDSPIFGAMACTVILGLNANVRRRALSVGSLEKSSGWALAGAAVLIVAFLAFNFWGAVSGFNRAHNEWFEGWKYRPFAAALLWVMAAGGLLLGMIQGRPKREGKDDPGGYT